MTEEEIARFRKHIEECGCSKMRYPHCDSWGCSSVQKLLDEREHLLAEIRELRSGDIHGSGRGFEVDIA